jgi:hypothetical protein
MKTRSRDATTTPGLPPPPAPTSRDANPWSIGEGPAPDRTGIPPSARASAKASAEVPGRPRRFPTKPPGSIGPRRRVTAVPLVILGFIAMTAIGLVADALESGDLEGAIGPIFAVVFVAFMIFRLLRSRRS